MRPGEFVDYYEVLGLTPTATAEDVREAWRRCARLYHPDLNPRKTSFRFQRAKEAYDTLVDPVRRRDYDRLYRLRKAAFTRSTGKGRGFGSFIGTPPGSRTPPPPGTGSRPPSGPSGPRTAPPGGTTRTSGRAGSPPGSSTRPGASPGSSTRPGGSPSPGTPPTGTPPRTGAPPGSASPGTPPTGGTTRTPPGRSGTGSTPPPGARTPGAGGPNADANTRGVRTRTTFRPATMFAEAKGSSLLDQLRDAVLHGGASRVTVRHNGNVVWEAHITSALMDDLTQWLVGPISALLKLLGANEQFQIEVTNELMEEYNRANQLYDEGKLEDAKAAYKRCLERDKYFAPGHLSLGAVYEAQKDIPIAVKCYQNAVKTDPAGEAGRFARENLRRLRGY